MKPLVSILIPSRKRIQSLMDALISIHQSAKASDFEILVRLDDDDKESLAERDMLYRVFGCTIFVGPRLGYEALDLGYYSSLEEKSSGTWSFIFGDDGRIEGDWMGELRKVPTTGFIVQPETSMLNASKYHRAEAQAFPIFPRMCWKKYTHEFPRPFDRSGHDLLIKNGWATWFLRGITFKHEDPTPKEIEEHRK